MAVFLHNHNIVRISDGQQVVECTIMKMCFDYAVVKFRGKQYRVSYCLIDRVVGHELLLPCA